MEDVFAMVDEYKAALSEIALPILLEIKEKNTDILYITSKSVDYGILQKNVFTNLFNRLELKGLHSLRISIAKLETVMNEYFDRISKKIQNFEAFCAKETEVIASSSQRKQQPSKNQKDDPKLRIAKKLEIFQKLKELILKDFDFRNTILRDLKEKSVDSNFFVKDEEDSTSSLMTKIEERVKFENVDLSLLNYSSNEDKKHNSPTEHINFYIEAWKIHPFLSQKSLNSIKKMLEDEGLS